MLNEISTKVATLADVNERLLEKSEAISSHLERYQRRRGGHQGFLGKTRKRKFWLTN